MNLWNRLDDLHARFNVLEHPFYQRWSAGELSRDDLATYAGEYRHAVVALADASARAAEAAPDPAVREQLSGHASEEAAHVELWDAFATSVGADLDREPAPETAACATAWAGQDRDFSGHLAALFAIESAQPPIAATKATGLREHYGFPTGPATVYFDVHEKRDVEHAAEGRELLERHATEADAERLAGEAERVLRANWALLDGVERVLGH